LKILLFNFLLSFTIVYPLYSSFIDIKIKNKCIMNYNTTLIIFYVIERLFGYKYNCFMVIDEYIVFY
jgi:hypothetical protein